MDTEKGKKKGKKWVVSLRVKFLFSSLLPYALILYTSPRLARYKLAPSRFSTLSHTNRQIGCIHYTTLNWEDGVLAKSFFVLELTSFYFFPPFLHHCLEESFAWIKRMPWVRRIFRSKSIRYIDCFCSGNLMFLGLFFIWISFQMFFYLT